MKRFIIILLTIFMIVMLAACNGGGAAPEQYVAEPVDVTPVVEEISDEVNEPVEDIIDEAQYDESTEYPEPYIDGFTLLFSGFLIYMDQNMNEVLDALGEPMGVFEAPSCAFDGIDRIFSYPGIQIHTYPEEDEDFVHTISLRDDSISIYGDIRLGSSWDLVREHFGTNYEQDFNMFTFTRGRTTLAFLVEDGIVEQIVFGLIMA